MAEIDTETEESTWEGLHTAKERSCLMCGSAFESAWAGERVCRKCKSQANWRKGDTSLSN